MKWKFSENETGLYYNYQRYYDPVLGRYTQTDPEDEGINLYAYCFNAPTRFVDPTGTHALANAYESVMDAIDCPWLEGFIEGGALGGLGFVAGLVEACLGEDAARAIFGGLYNNGYFMWGRGVGNVVGVIEMFLSPYTVNLRASVLAGVGIAQTMPFLKDYLDNNGVTFNTVLKAARAGVVSALIGNYVGSWMSGKTTTLDRVIQAGISGFVSSSTDLPPIN